MNKILQEILQKLWQTIAVWKSPRKRVNLDFRLDYDKTDVGDEKWQCYLKENIPTVISKHFFRVTLCSMQHPGSFWELTPKDDIKEFLV